MRRVAVDLETHLIRPGMLAPKMVCLSWFDGQRGQLLGAEDGLKFFRDLIEGGKTILGHNITYDLGVLCAEDPSLVDLVFKAYIDNRIACTMVRQKLLDIANGELEFRNTPTGAAKAEWSLKALAKLWLGETLAKEGTYRLHYASLDNIPIEAWPSEARLYAEGDARATWNVYDKQMARGIIEDEPRQNRAAWALHLMGVWGIRTDSKAANRLKKVLEKEQAEFKPTLLEHGILREDGTKDLARIRELVSKSFISPPKTPIGSVKTDEETLRESGHPGLKTLADSILGAKTLSTYVPVLLQGAENPITSSPNVLVASGRTSWARPNLQNPPRGGLVREAFIPRAGYLFAMADYDTLELRALAQVCLSLFKQSSLADALRAGQDLHAKLGAEFLGISYTDMMHRLGEGDETCKKARQEAKGFNFGRPGGMGAEKMVAYLKASGTILDPNPLAAVEKARQYIHKWHQAWPEMHQFFNYVKTTALSGQIVQLKSGRIRGGVKFTDGANSLFQGLAADGAKEALWEVSRECYTDKSSPLFGSRPVLFLHDEIGLEVPEATANDAAKRLARVMIDSMSKWITDVPITCKPVLMRRWYKGAEPVDIDGKIVPCKPSKEAGKTRWVYDDGKEKYAS